ncbi:MAG: TetR/AcrR family transcriptional regulator [Eubacterium sp.]
MNQVGRLDEKKKKKREDLLNAAYELFTSQGVFDTSISNIVKNANMAKGTFYLYFKDKYDIRNALITKKAGELFSIAYEQMYQKQFSSLEETVLCVADIIIDQLNEDKTLLEFIAKNLQWGLFHKVLLEGENEVSKSFYDWYTELIKNSGRKFKNHELVIYMIVELINSTCYNVILHGEPVSLEELKDELHELIPVIIRTQEIVER